jgi:aminoglycoside 2'-N-acetyltransferase I
MTEFAFTLKRLEDLPTVERQRVDEIDRLSFHSNENDPEWALPQWLLLGTCDQLQVAQVGILIRDIQVGDETIRVAGIGGVATHPDWRRNGYAHRLMVEAARVSREQLGASFGLLDCEPARIPFYSRLGWQVVTARVWIDQRGVRQLFTDPIMILPLGQRTWPEGTVDLLGDPW